MAFFATLLMGCVAGLFFLKIWTEPAPASADASMPSDLRDSAASIPADSAKAKKPVLLACPIGLGPVGGAAMGFPPPDYLKNSRKN